jgi:peptidoglycan/LPS O-acetylase OafA/YrhL
VLNAPLWSLFFEFWVANIAFGVLRKSLNAPFLGIIICLSAIGMLIGETRFYTLSFGQHWISFPYGFSRVGFSFFLGVAIARLRTLHPPQLSVPSWMFLLGLPIVLCLPMQRHLSQIYELVCVFFIFPIMIYFGSEAKEYDSRLGQALGDASYALYVVHWPLLILANYALERTHTPRALQWQLLFTICIVPIAWSLGQIDLKMRSAVMKFVRTKRERGEALGYAGKRDEAQKQFELAAGLDLSAADKAE